MYYPVESCQKDPRMLAFLFGIIHEPGRTGVSTMSVAVYSLPGTDAKNPSSNSTAPTIRNGLVAMSIRSTY